MPSSSADSSLEWQEWKDGIRLPAYQSRLLCSTRDPIAEAIKWCDHYTKGLESSSLLIVIGLGAGFHIKELHLRYPSKQIVVIEKESELISAFRLQDFENIQIYGSEALEDVLKEPKIISSSVMTFLPAISHWKDEAFQIADQLLGRTSNALVELLRASGLSATLSNQSEKVTPSRDLFRQLCDTAKNEEEKALWGALGELVK